jgi:hypothetical protein
MRRLPTAALILSFVLRLPAVPAPHRDSHQRRLRRPATHHSGPLFSLGVGRLEWAQICLSVPYCMGGTYRSYQHRGLGIRLSGDLQ